MVIKREIVQVERADKHLYINVREVIALREIPQNSCGNCVMHTAVIRGSATGTKAKTLTSRGSDLVRRCSSTAFGSPMLSDKSTYTKI